jgi:hypothetical protein
MRAGICHSGGSRNTFPPEPEGINLQISTRNATTPIKVGTRLTDTKSNISATAKYTPQHAIKLAAQLNLKENLE